LAIPGAVSELSVDFLERMITHRVEACTITSFEADPNFGAAGKMSEVARIEVTHSEAGCAPDSLVIKLPRPGSLAQDTGSYLREAQVFQFLRGKNDLPVPQMYGYEPGEDPNNVVIALEEIEGARTVSGVDGCSLDEASEVLRNLAQIHSLFWNASDLPSMGDSGDLAKRLNNSAESSWDVFVERSGSRVGNALSHYEWVKDNLLPIVELRAGSPHTLAHGDFQPENILFTSDPKRSNVIIDWQMAGAGQGVFDVSIFITDSLSVQDRRKHEDFLLKAYHSTLTADGNIDYSYDDMHLNYRAGIGIAIYKAIMKAGQVGANQIREDAGVRADAAVEHTLAVIEDLDPVDAVKQLMP
jgi:aminoglycoside phosphotransferase (APT) family kinase protein